MKSMLIQCQYCGQLKNKDGSWNGKKQKIIRSGKITHGPCPECYDREMNRIKGE